MSKGKLITLYGINNIGKTTQAKALIDNLKAAGFEAVYVKYPVYDIEPSGPFLNNALRNSNNQQKISEDELQMWYTINRYQYEATLKQMLNEGKIVVAEDYAATGIAWGTAKGGNMEWLETINKCLLKEDFVVFMKGKRNMHAREENHLHESNNELVETTAFVFENLAQKHAWPTVHVNGSIAETADEIWKIVKKFLKID